MAHGNTPHMLYSHPSAHPLTLAIHCPHHPPLSCSPTHTHVMVTDPSRGASTKDIIPIVTPWGQDLQS